MKIRFDLGNYPAAQDMIVIIMQEKNVSADEAVAHALNDENYLAIVSVEWVKVALSLWGHEDWERKWNKLNEVLEIEIDDHKEHLLKDIMEREEVSIEDAICYFLIFMMDSLGYHI